MISDDLANLSDFCLGLAVKNAKLQPEQLAYLAKVLLDMSRQIARLERLPFDPAHLRLDTHDDE